MYVVLFIKAITAADAVGILWDIHFTYEPDNLSMKYVRFFQYNIYTMTLLDRDMEMSRYDS